MSGMTDSAREAYQELSRWSIKVRHFEHILSVLHRAAVIEEQLDQRQGELQRLGDAVAMKQSDMLGLDEQLTQARTRMQEKLSAEESTLRAVLTDLEHTIETRRQELTTIDAQVTEARETLAEAARLRERLL